MTRTNILYWVFTTLFCAMMLFSGITQFIAAKDAIYVMDVLKLPAYLLPFLGIAKFAGVISLVIPLYAKIKEWAYAGFAFDLVGATYCMIAVGGAIEQWGFMIIPIGFCMLSYIYYKRKIAQAHR